MKYHRIIQAALETPWAILPAKLAQIQVFLQRKARGEDIPADEVRAAVGDEQRAGAAVQRFGSVAVVPVLGTIAHRMEAFNSISSPGGTSTNLLANRLRQAVADPQVSAVVLDVDSPGGAVAGVPEVADLIAELKQSKRIVAVANDMAASAAYWIAAAASEFVVTPSGQVGSIGVFMMHQDLSQMAEREGVKTTFIHAGPHKVEGNAFEPLSAEARAALQAKVDGYYDMFVKAVARGRGVPPATVRDKFGGGRMLLAKDALAAGMVDRVETMDAVLERLVRRAAARSGAGPRAEVRTKRDFEAFLRDVGGYSHTEAKRIASDGFGPDTPRDEAGGPHAPTGTVGESAETVPGRTPDPQEDAELKRGLQSLADSFRP